jgi:hypothetical protein
MRARFVRGEDPRKMMDIGPSFLEKEKIRSINWGMTEDFLEEILNRDYGFEEYMGFNILTYPFIFSSGKIEWFATTHRFETPGRRGFSFLSSSTGKTAQSKESATKDLKAKIRKKLRDES